MFNREQFLAFVEESHQKIIGLNKTKGHDYAGDEDALSNFKESGEDAGITPEQAWLVFFGKHLSAIKTYVREGSVQSEPIEGRILDAILYLYLLLGLVTDAQESSSRSVHNPPQN